MVAFLSHSLEWHNPNQMNLPLQNSKNDHGQLFATKNKYSIYTKYSNIHMFNENVDTSIFKVYPIIQLILFRGNLRFNCTHYIQCQNNHWIVHGTYHMVKTLFEIFILKPIFFINIKIN